MNMPATRHRFTVDDWHQMIEAGVVHRGQRLELLDGEIFEMAPIGPRHTSVVDRLTRFWVTRLGERAIVRVQGPTEASRRSEPEPDVMLLRERTDFYVKRHPGPDNVLLVIEVADSSLDYDHAKLRIYAQAGMAEIWIVDLRHDHVEVYRDPRPEGYASPRVVSRGETLSCLAFPEIGLDVADILG
jgi:Uma2 family endonuclease